MLITITLLVMFVLILVYGPTSPQGSRLVFGFVMLILLTGILLIAPMCLPAWSNGFITLDRFFKQMIGALFGFGDFLNPSINTWPLT